MNKKINLALAIFMGFDINKGSINKRGKNDKCNKKAKARREEISS